MTGLKYFNQKYEGCWLHRKLRFFFRELKYAWQRAWKGYDDTALWSFSDAFRDWVIPVLEEKIEIIQDNEECCWLPDTDTKTRCIANREEMQSALESLIINLQMTDIDHVIEQIYGKNWHEKGKSLDWEKIHITCREKCTEAFNALCYWFNYL